MALDDITDAETEAAVIDYIETHPGEAVVLVEDTESEGELDVFYTMEDGEPTIVLQNGVRRDLMGDDYEYDDHQTVDRIVDASEVPDDPGHDESPLGGSVSDDDGPMAMLEDLSDAAEALDEDGLDADADALEPAIEDLESLVESAVDVDDEDAEADLRGAADAMGRIIEGDGDEDDVERALETVATVGQELQMMILEQMLA